VADLVVDGCFFNGNSQMNRGITLRNACPAPRVASNDYRLLNQQMLVVEGTAPGAVEYGNRQNLAMPLISPGWEMFGLSRGAVEIPRYQNRPGTAVGFAPGTVIWEEASRHLWVVVTATADGWKQILFADE